MTERSISMVTPMVLATNAGTKTQTRRTVKFPERWEHDCAMRDPMDGKKCDPPWPHQLCADGRYHKIPCPYGKPGDVLKLKEAAWLWCEKVRDGWTPRRKPKFRYVPVKDSASKPIYRADTDKKPEDRFHSDAPRRLGSHNDGFGYRLKIPRYLPAWAVRTRLQIVSIKVERLQDITAADAIAEGVGTGPTEAREAFKFLWESINSPESWQANPFVWRIEFKKL